MKISTFFACAAYSALALWALTGCKEEEPAKTGLYCQASKP